MQRQPQAAPPCTRPSVPMVPTACLDGSFRAPKRADGANGMLERAFCPVTSVPLAPATRLRVRRQDALARHTGTEAAFRVRACVNFWAYGKFWYPIAARN